MNRLVAEADRWANFLHTSEFDACGLPMMFDAAHGYTYFAGNFWMAKGAYLTGLPRYRDFAATGAPPMPPMDRHLAELAVNRAKRMRGYPIDGTLLTPMTVRRFLESSRGR